MAYGSYGMQGFIPPQEEEAANTPDQNSFKSRLAVMLKQQKEGGGGEAMDPMTDPLAMLDSIMRD